MRQMNIIIIFPNIIFKNEHCFYKQQISKLFIANICYLLMSQALQNSQETNKDQQSICQKCQVSHKNDNFEHLCTKCLNQQKSQEKNVLQQLQKHRQDQIGYQTPTKCAKKEIGTHRQNQLIEAPRKIRNKHPKRRDSSQSFRNILLQMDELEKTSRKNKIQCSEFYQDTQQIRLQALQKQNNNPSNTEKERQNDEQYIDNFFRKHQNPQKQDQIRAKIKRIHRDFSELKDEQLIQKKRSLKQLQVSDKQHHVQGRCTLCKKKTGLLGITCNYCKSQHCRHHRLPQDHDCKYNFYQDARKKMKQAVDSLLPKHKGKISQI